MPRRFSVCDQLFDTAMVYENYCFANIKQLIIYLDLVWESGSEYWSVVSFSDSDIIDLDTVTGIYCSVYCSIVPECEQKGCVVGDNC